MSDKQRPSARWSEVVDSAPELAQAVQDRFEAHPHHVVATLHADGRPRVTGTNVMFNDGMFWMGSMDSSRRGADLLRDPRCAVHSAPLDEEMGEGAGDARVEAIAQALEPEVSQRLIRQIFGEDASMDGDMSELRVCSLSLVTIEGEEMRIRWWTPEGGERDLRRS
ncbi:MAG: pyridoxamine 5'-phosphate oxidase family protein [Actinomycetia bacterium]|nr:pyridoxamine 5'-phosphate oxidase family protein [Actinomycetes bacterium]